MANNFLQEVVMVGPWWRTLWTGLGALALLVLTGSGAARPRYQWELGAVMGSGEGLSLLYREDYHRALHVSGRVRASDSMDFEVAMQKYVSPPEIKQYGFDVYGGLGVLGEAQRDRELRELYSLVLPVGGEWHWPRLPFGCFADYALIAGPLPLTPVRARLQFGLRAIF